MPCLQPWGDIKREKVSNPSSKLLPLCFANAMVNRTVSRNENLSRNWRADQSRARSRHRTARVRPQREYSGRDGLVLGKTPRAHAADRHSKSSRSAGTRARAGKTGCNRRNQANAISHYNDGTTQPAPRGTHCRRHGEGSAPLWNRCSQRRFWRASTRSRNTTRWPDGISA